LDWALLAGSLIGVLGLAAFAWLMAPSGADIVSEEEAKRAAEEAHAGFHASRAFVSEDRRAALVVGEAGDAVLLKAHGTQLASRHIPGRVTAEAFDGDVILSSGERMFGAVRLRLPQEARDTLLRMM
jgi:hypothetical protein